MNEMDQERRQLAASRSMAAAAKAEEMLTRYLKQAWEAAGLTWTDDNDAEVGEIVSLITEAAADAAQARG